MTTALTSVMVFRKPFFFTAKERAENLQAQLDAHLNRLAIVQEWCDQNPSPFYREWRCMYAMLELKEFEYQSAVDVLELYHECV